MPSKIRQFSIVLHNVLESSKPSVESFCLTLNPTSHVIAYEPYPDQDGFHSHVFIKFQNPRAFKSVLNSFENLMTSPSILAPKPEGEERSWGRVQVDQMRGTFEQATAYLTNPKKDKPVDPNVTLHVKPDPLEEVRKAIANEHLRKYWGTYFFPDVGLMLMGFQYVELLMRRNTEVPSSWLQTYNFINALDA